MTVSFENHLERVRVAARTLPEVDEVVSEGKPAFKVRGRLVARLEDETTLLLPCPIEEKGLLMQAAPGIYFDAERYRNERAILLHLERISDEELTLRIANAWHMQAPAEIAGKADDEDRTD